MNRKHAFENGFLSVSRPSGHSNDGDDGDYDDDDQVSSNLQNRMANDSAGQKRISMVVVVVVFKTIDGGISNRRSVPGAGRPLSAGSNNKKGKKDSVRELEQILFSILNVRSNSARTGRNETPSGIPFTNSPVKKRAPNEFSRLSSGQSLTGH